MPIRADLRHFYGREWRDEHRPRILARAENCCEACAKPNGVQLLTMTWRADSGERMMIWRWNTIIPRWWDQNGEPWSGTPPPGVRLRPIKVVLAVAHRNHDPADNRDENLAAWCNWHHLQHDQERHRDTRAGRKDRGRPLLAEAS